jgi:hypothetical protein
MFYYTTYSAFVDNVTKPNINTAFNLLLYPVNIQHLPLHYGQQNASYTEL